MKSTFTWTSFLGRWKKWTRFGRFPVRAKVPKANVRTGATNKTKANRNIQEFDTGSRRVVMDMIYESRRVVSKYVLIWWVRKTKSEWEIILRKYETTVGELRNAVCQHHYECDIHRYNRFIFLFHAKNSHKTFTSMFSVWTEPHDRAERFCNSRNMLSLNNFFIISRTHRRTVNHTVQTPNSRARNSRIKHLTPPNHPPRADRFVY